MHLQRHLDTLLATFQAPLDGWATLLLTNSSVAHPFRILCERARAKQQPMVRAWLLNLPSGPSPPNPKKQIPLPLIAHTLLYIHYSNNKMFHVEHNSVHPTFHVELACFHLATNPQAHAAPGRCCRHSTTPARAHLVLWECLPAPAEHRL